MKKIITDKDLKLTIETYKNFTGSWPEFTILMNDLLGSNFNESTFRKPIQDYEKITKLLIDDYPNQDLQLKKLYAEKEIKLNKKIKETQFYNKQFNKVKKELFNMENLADIITNSVKPLPKPTEIPISLEKSKESNIFVISDMQEDGSGFSHQVYRVVEEQIIKRVKNEKLKEIYIFENGDGIEGVLRISALYDNAGGYVQQLNYYQAALSNLLNNVSKHCKIKFSIINSNHTEIRPFGASRGQIKDEDVTFLILAYIKAATKDNKNITFLQNPKSPRDLNSNIITINGYTIFQHHGDNSGSSPKNAENYYNKIMRYYSKNIDLVLVAHYHHLCVKTINALENGGDSLVIHSPALDPRQIKSNEEDLMLSSSPAFLRLKIENGKGITMIESIKTGILIYGY